MALRQENTEIEREIFKKLLRVFFEFSREKKMRLEIITYRWDTKSVTLFWEAEIARNIDCFLINGFLADPHGSYRLMIEINAWRDRGDTRTWRSEIMGSLPLEPSQQFSEKTLKDLKAKLDEAYRIVCFWKAIDLNRVSKVVPKPSK